MKKLIDKQILESLINEDLNCKQIAEKLFVHSDTIRKNLRLHNLKTNIGSGGQNRILNNNPFEDLNNSNVQYWLGFLAADGNISSKKYYFSCHQANDDRFHISTFRDFVSKDVNIRIYNNKNGNETYEISVGNKKLHQHLINLGLTPNKSRTLNYLGEFTGHFIRGVFDGDGSCSTNNIPKITTGSPLFRDQLINYFNENNIKCNYREKGDKNAINPVFDVQILKNGRENFYNLLYSNYDYCLERKRLKVLNILSRNKIG